jgi:hypothetical protein
LKKVESLCERTKSVEAQLLVNERLRADIASLSSKQDCDRRSNAEVLKNVPILCHWAETIEHQMTADKTNAMAIRTELEIVKSSISKLAVPRIVGAFKINETIHITVPGLSPLSEGIISYLTKLAGGNVCDRQRVHAFSEKCAGDGWLPRNAADLSTDSEFCSEDQLNQTFGYDFKDSQLISPTHYAIRTRPNYGAGDRHLKSWVIEVTNDRSKENSWIEIDRRENNHDLNGRGVVQTFRCSNPQNGEFRYIRIRQIGPNHYGYHHMAFAAFEIFGQLRVRNSVPM